MTHDLELMIAFLVPLCTAMCALLLMAFVG